MNGEAGLNPAGLPRKKKKIEEKEEKKRERAIRERKGRRRERRALRRERDGEAGLIPRNYQER